MDGSMDEPHCPAVSSQPGGGVTGQILRSIRNIGPSKHWPIKTMDQQKDWTIRKTVPPETLYPQKHWTTRNIGIPETLDYQKHCTTITDIILMKLFRFFILNKRPFYKTVMTYRSGNHSANNPVRLMAIINIIIYRGSNLPQAKFPKLFGPDRKQNNIIRKTLKHVK